MSGLRQKTLIAIATSLGFAAPAVLADTFGLGPAAENPPSNPTSRVVNYVHDDGTVENGIGITGTNPFDIIWLNSFPTQVGGERIVSIQAAIGSPADTRPYNGLAMTVLLYNDPDGGLPNNATLLTSLNTTVANANTGILNNYDITDTNITTSNFWVGVVMHGLPGGNGFVASIDQTAPTTNNVSWAGFTVSAPLNENNLNGIPAGQSGFIEGFGLPGNWAVRAVGDPIPEPASLGLLVLGGLMLARRR
jgi:hypothetical protein